MAKIVHIHTPLADESLYSTDYTVKIRPQGQGSKLFDINAFAHDITIG